MIGFLVCVGLILVTPLLLHWLFPNNMGLAIIVGIVLNPFVLFFCGQMVREGKNGDSDNEHDCLTEDDGW